ncbi:hypothetical protein PACTADRAFT_15190 [Pachysolen tannophilus NRRL Y-2460]|uniref:Uncharacterized protein n=1 Tax=Pachysolen tannophilus NRRL Y-2460 TaxID=669874 RepID=A0A1E4TY36_PACTA|nr:hypothetical protein PACTADRAFT_15190 [Pachysolen tannophilus NRRL Y-2460]
MSKVNCGLGDLGGLGDLRDGDGILVKDDLLKLKEHFIRTKSVEIEFLEKCSSPIFKSLQSAKGADEYRIICCDTFSLLLLRCSQAVLNANADEKLRLQEIFNAEITTYIYRYVIDFWNESGAPLGNSLREMFSKMLIFLNKLYDVRFRTSLYQKWVLIILNDVSFTMRVLYYMVETLSKEFDESYDFILKHKPGFINTSLSYMWSTALSNSIGKCLSALYKNHFNELRLKLEQDADIVWLQTWESLIIENLQNLQLRKNIQNYLLPNLFKVSSNSFVNFIKNMNALIGENFENEGLVAIMLSCLSIGQELAIVEEPFHGTNAIISVELLSALLSHQSGFIKITSLSLLTSSAQGSKSVQPCVLNLILEKLPIFTNEIDLEVANEFISIFKKFILRLRDSSYALNRDAMKMIKKNKFLDEAEEKCKQVEISKQFLIQVLNFISDNLRPGVCYQRCYSCLKILNVLIKSGLDETVDRQYYEKLHIDYPFNLEIYSDRKLSRLLIDNVANDFEDVRNLAVSILLMSSNLNSYENDLNLIVDRSFEMLADLRGRKGISGAKSLQFLCESSSLNKSFKKNILTRLVHDLTDRIQLAKLDLRSAVYQSNIYGYYLALNLIFENLKIDDEDFYSNLINIVVLSIFDIWTLAKPILSHDSPEGNLPKELQDQEEDLSCELEAKYGPATQVVLSYSWRAVKESSALLSTFLSRIDDDRIAFSTEDYDLIRIGDLIIQQLSTIRHPGAFSSVYPTFLSCCERCFNKKSDLPSIWLRKNLSLIEDQNHLITRRSAGLPFLITGILTAEFKYNKKLKNKNKKPIEKKLSDNDLILFKFTFEELIRIGSLPFEDGNGEEKLALPQVHAFNCIRALIVESQLSELSNFYIDKSLDLCLAKFSSRTWSIRNVSVMLFTAIQNRLFGTKKIDKNYLCTISSRLFFSRYKNLAKILLKNFQNSLAISQNEDMESIFPILSLLSRLHSTRGFNPILEFEPLLIECLGNKHWKVREMAARALPSVINDDEFYEECCSLLQKADNSNKNMIHGLLLAIKELLIRSGLKNTSESFIIPSKVTEMFLLRLDSLLFENNCYASCITYVQILDFIVSKNFDYSNFPEEILNKLGNYFLKHNILNHLDGSKQLLLSRLSTLVLKVYGKNNDLENLGDLLQVCLLSEFYECQLSAITYTSQNISILSSTIKLDIIDTLWFILSNAKFWSHVKAASLRLLKDLLINSDNAYEYDNDHLLERTKLLLEFMDEELNSEDVRSTSLAALGAFVARLNDSYYFETWLQLCEIHSSDDKPFNVRYSAMTSLISYLQTNNNRKANINFVKVLLKLYLFLFDDDDELREHASEFISRSIMDIKFHLVPIEIQNRFTEFLIHNYSISLIYDIILNDYYIKRLNYNIEDIVKCDQDNFLFSFEKQNFYRNVIDQHRIYIELLVLVASEFDSSTIEKLSTQIRENVDNLFKIINLFENDNYMGWLKEEENFNVFYCILFDIKFIKELIKDQRKFDALFGESLNKLNRISIRNNLHQLCKEQIVNSQN